MSDVLKHEEIWSLPLVEYPAKDQDGRDVVIRPKLPEEHESHHPLEQTPAYFYNLKLVLENPDEVVPSTSQNPNALKSAEFGETKIYIKNDFVKQLNIPGYSNMENEQTQVVVFYGNEKWQNKTKNFTRTYGIKVKS